ncbi:MAG: L,D-transpeptidase family protein [Candidatus Aminicenantes bacterium]|nr:L,D-transpeptidase family protein [Candidatus Aminicenantes bacterium]
MKNFCRFALLALIAARPFPSIAAKAFPPPSDPVDTAVVIRERLAVSPRGEGLVCNGDCLVGSEALQRFYERRMYEPAWTRDGMPLANIDDMIRVLAQVWLDGLKSGAYHLEPIRSALDAVQTDRRGAAGDSALRLADLDLLLSDAFILLATHLASGTVEPAMIESEWFIQVNRPDAAAVLRRALNMSDVAGALDTLRPSRPEYASLREALRELTNVVARGGWPPVPIGPSIRPGDSGPRVLALRERLALGGDLAAGSAAAGPAAAADVYDDTVAAAVRRFQTRLGTAPDGVVGQETLASLNVSAEERLTQLKVNLERWRWLPRDFGRRYLMINIPAFHLDLVENGSVTLDMRVVVGSNAAQTPVFEEMMTTIEVNPVWNVPATIAAKEIVANVKREPGYFRRWGYKLYDGWGAGASEIDPSAVDWNALNESNFRYRVLQAPGPLNSLGRLAFLFPNPWAVYLHDTPQRELFQQSTRSFSHGCIRIAWPLDLAVALLRNDPAWTKESLQAAIDGGANKMLSIPDPLPVYIVYLTAWREPDGAIHFRKDIYGRDAALAQALGGDIPPAPLPATGR